MKSKFGQYIPGALWKRYQPRHNLVSQNISPKAISQVHTNCAIKSLIKSKEYGRHIVLHAGQSPLFPILNSAPMSEDDIISLADLINKAINLDSFIRYLKNRYDVPEDISRRKIREVVNFDTLYEELRVMGYNLPTKKISGE